MIAAAFISHNDDWCLVHKLRVMSSLCDVVRVVLDRSPQSEQICRRFPKVECRHIDSAESSLGMAHDGPMWCEGRLRQAAWDWAVECKPKWVLLGDTDEVPTPTMAPWLRHGPDERVDCFYADWVNLIHDAAHAIGGTASPWSYQAAGSNKKGLLVRYRPGRPYVYHTARRHVRLEPSPLSIGKAVVDASHRIGPASLVHYRWANWPRWEMSDMARLPAYQPWPASDAEIVGVPRHWLWRWDADEYLKQLTEPVAVVGNGPFRDWKLLDDFPSVLRFNNWREGKATCWVTNCFESVSHRDWPHDLLTVYTDDEQRDRLSKWLGMYPHMYQPRESWHEAARVWKREKPSTGLVVLARLLHHGKRVHAFGFDGMTTGHQWDAAHQHDHSEETEALAAMANAGVTFH